MVRGILNSQMGFISQDHISISTPLLSQGSELASELTRKQTGTPVCGVVGSRDPRGFPLSTTMDAVKLKTFMSAQIAIKIREIAEATDKKYTDPS